jgi:hypothetical protein
MEQIGQIFAQWVIVYFGQFYKDYRSSQKFWATFLSSIDYLLLLTFGAILSQTLSSHPVTTCFLRFLNCCLETLHLSWQASTST